MKKTTIYLISICCLFCVKMGAQNLQQRIDSAFYHFNQSQSMEEINRIVNELGRTPGKQALLSYWKAYAKYKQTLAYNELHSKEKSCKKECAKILSQAITLLESNPHKTSDDYALMSIIRNVSISFCPRLKIPFLSNAAKSDAQAAIDMDKENIRAHIAAGVQDYYTPAMYGGGRRYEDCFLKALELPDKQDRNPHSPSWGREEAYVYLVVHYYRKGEKDKAKDLLDEGLSFYPKEPRLIHLASQM